MPGTVSKWLPDDLWERVHPLLPKPRRRRSRYPGRKPLHDRAVLPGIIFVLRTGIRGARCRLSWGAAPE